MNVKKICLGNSLKVNNIQLEALALFNNEPTAKNKIGQQIRRKTKFNKEVQFNYCKSDKENAGLHNFMQIKNRYEQKSNSFGLKVQSRRNSAKKSIDMQRRKSAKSVRFSQKFEEPGLKRNSSTSSILKNGSAMKKSFLSDKNSLNTSICSNICQEDQSNENQMLNRVLKEKYERLLNKLQQDKGKHCDELYPPLWSSLSYTNKPQFNQIRWRRIGQIFDGKSIVVWESNSEMRIQCGRYSKNSVVANCLNTIKSSNFLLQKMFETQKYNPHGLYYVKIHQNSTWKYVVIDDYIPVYQSKSGSRQEPAFLTLSSSSDQVQIWPLLLQKAYAKSYSTYDSLEKGNELDFLQELSGCPVEQIAVFPDNMQKIHEQMQNFDSILLSRGKSGLFHPLIPRRSQLIFEDSRRNYSRVGLASDSLFLQHFDSVFCVCLHKFYYTGTCTVKYSQRGENLDYISLRTIKVQQHTECVLNVSQKDLKHYGDNYQYTWMRMIVAMKEGPENYRWIGGVYGKTKNLSLRCHLEPAQYYIFLMPEWNFAKGFDFNLQFHANTKCLFERKPYKGNEKIIPEVAMDLAQSNGTLRQLGRSTCIYSYIDRKVGLIIENINNEKSNGSTYIYRSIEGLQKSGKRLVQAFNKEFREDPSIEVKIEKLNHYTVVLGTVGGVDQHFLNTFCFGS